MRTLRVVLLACLVGPGAVVAAPGSWVDGAPRLVVSLSDGETPSGELTPPATAWAGGRIDSVLWRFSVSPGTTVRARLCHAERCTPLSGGRGMTRSLAGLTARGPLHFRFSLPAGQRPVAIEGLQVIVNYR